MKFDAKTEQEIAEDGLIPEGHYNFEVLNAVDKTSKAGNEMIELKLRVWDAKGTAHVCFDWLLAAMAHKLKHFCEVTNMDSAYESGSLAADDCIGKSGKLWLVIAPAKGDFPAKNSVKDYVVLPPSQRAAASQTEAFDSPDVPF